MAGPHRFVLVFLIGLGWLAVLATPKASAGSTASYAEPAVGGALQVLCEGDCSQLPAVRLPGDDHAFDFEAGLKAVLDGVDLTIQTEGSVFVHGPIRAQGDVTLSASDLTIFDTEISSGGLSAGADIILRVDRDLTLGDVIQLPFFPEVTLETASLDLAAFDRPICACVATRLSIPAAQAGPVALSSNGSLTLAAAVLGVRSSSGPTPGIFVSKSGDLYLDLSMVMLGSLTIESEASIVIAGARSMPVPEPGTGVLMALGLAVLARRHS